MQETPTTLATETKVRSSRAILEIIKKEGPHESQWLGRKLGITTMAVRQHLYELERQGLVTHELQPRPVGRPAKLWNLTPAAASEFPDAHAELSVSLLSAMQITFGEGGLNKVLAVRKDQMLAAYREKLPTNAPLTERLEALAALRTAEGYMAALETDSDGTPLLVENHCPICAAASACQGFCSIELDLFQQLLGPDVKVRRTEHIQLGARRCAYRIEAV